MAVYLHEEDLPAGVLGPGPVAVDTETMGLITPRDRLCLVQISDGNGDEHLVRFGPCSDYDAPNLKAVLADPALKAEMAKRGMRFDPASGREVQALVARAMDFPPDMLPGIKAIFEQVVAPQK